MLVAEGIFHLVQHGPQCARIIAAIPDRQGIQAVSQHPGHAEQPYIGSGLGQSCRRQLALDPRPQGGAVTRAVIAVVKGEQVEPVMGKQTVARCRFSDMVDIEDDIEDAIDEFIGLRPRPAMHDLADIQVGGHGARAGMA